MAAKDYTNIVGKKFNKLTILCEAPKRSGNDNRRVSALCDCGNAGTFVRSEVIHGKTKSCGCLNAGSNVVHGHTLRRKPSPEYYSWASMLTRCMNPKFVFYDRYGGRGISVCERWMKFENFLADMGARPTGTSLDRLDFDGNYEPENCRWSDKATQSNNKKLK